MIYSMTGFGQAEQSAAGWRCLAEMRSFNGKFLDIRLRLPPGLAYLDESLKKPIKEQCERGNIECHLSLTPENGFGSSLTMNRPLLEKYGELIREVREVLDQPVHVSLGDLLNNRELVQSQNWEECREDIEALLRGTLESALAGLLEMRRTEGNALQKTLLGHTGNLEGLARQIKPLTTELPDRYAKRLRENLARLAEGAIQNEDRILQEITIYADRCDVSEEIARLEAHSEHIRSLIDGGGSVGRKFEFLLQEVNREANTLSTKCNDARISALVVEMKSEIEKLREQVQNIE